MLCFLTLAVAAGVTVRPGDDINTLTSSLAAGSEVIFSGGTYTITDPLLWTATGTASDPVILRAADGEKPVIELDGGWRAVGIVDSTHLVVRGISFRGAEGWEEQYAVGISVENSSAITIEDGEIQRFGSSGIYTGGDCSDVTIQRVHIHDIGSGAGIYAGCGDASCWTQDSLFANNWIHDIGALAESGDGISLEHGDNNVVVQDNVIHDTWRAGIVTRSTEYSPPNVLTGNAIWNAVEYGIRADGAVTARNNVVFGVEGYGLYTRNSERDTLQDAVFSHNTIADTTSYGILLEGWAGRTGMVLANNLVINPIGLGVYLEQDAAADASNTLSHNVVSGYIAYGEHAPEDWPEGFLPGHGEADVLDVTAPDLYPASGSAAVNAGDPSADAWVPATDFNGAPRDGKAPDAGAYERDGAANPGWAIGEGFKVVGYDDPTAVQGGCCEEKGKGGEAAGLLLGVMGLARRRRRAHSQAG